MCLILFDPVIMTTDNQFRFLESYAAGCGKSDSPILLYRAEMRVPSIVHNHVDVTVDRNGLVSSFVKRSLIVE